MDIKLALEVLKSHKDRDDLGSKVYEAIDTVVKEFERHQLHKEMLSKISTKEYGEDGVGLSKEDLDECLYK